MTIPSLPFDSLYKFIFVGGLILCITSLYLRNEFVNNLPDSSSRIDSITRIYKLASLKAHLDTIESSKLMSQYIQKSRQYIVSDNVDRSPYLSLIEKIRNLKYHNDSISIEMQILKNKFDLRYHLANKETVLAKDYLILIWIGLFVTLIGAISWYKQQKISDSIHKLQLEILKKELNQKIEKNIYRRR